MLVHATAAAVLLREASAAKSKSGSSLEFFIVILAAVVIFVMFRRSGAQRRAAAAGRQGGNLEVGRQVLLRAGIYGRIRGFDGDDVLVETAPGVVIKVVRGAIGQVLPLPESPEVAAAGLGDEGATALDPQAPYDLGPGTANEDAPTEPSAELTEPEDPDQVPQPGPDGEGPPAP